MFLRLDTIAEKKLAGKKIITTYANNQTPALWAAFMPLLKQIPHRANGNLISMQVYDKAFSFSQFDIHQPFQKWAAAEVTTFNEMPPTIEPYTVPAGLYAVFLHRGTVAEAPKTWGYIFNTWLPGSHYQLDSRPHFEILDTRYKHNQPDSEEEVWIPIIAKSNTD